MTGRAQIGDGDSLVIDGERLRLRGIDAPEMDQICGGANGDVACGRLARRHLAGLIGGAPVACTGWEIDRYGRLLVECRARGTDLNAAMVRDGWAVAYGDYEAEEAEARRQGRGLWRHDFDRPSDWRHTHGREQAPVAPAGFVRRALTAMADWLKSWIE